MTRDRTTMVRERDVTRRHGFVWRHGFIWRHGGAGLVGTSCIAIGALGIGWLPLDSDLLRFPVVDALRSSLAGSLTARGFVLIGLAILLQAWLTLGSALARERATRMRDLAIVLAMWSAPLLLAPPLFSRDVYSYYVQGRLFGSGVDPTTTGVAAIPGWFNDGADPMWAESPTPYGPFFLLIERSIAGFAHPNATLAALLFRLVSVAGVALLLWAVPTLANRHGLDGRQALWIGVLNPLVLMHFVSGAHNDALMAGLVVAGFALLAQRRCQWGVVLIAVAVAVKPIAAIALPFAGLMWAGIGAPWAWRIKAWAYTVVVTALTFVTIMLAAQAGAGLLSAAFGTPSAVLTWLSPPTAVGQAIGLATTALGITSDPLLPLTILRTLGTLAALVIVAWLILRPQGRSPVRGAALAFSAVIVLGPVIQPWYLLWALPLFAASGLPRREMRIAVALTAVFTVHAMVESATTSDNVLDITDLMTFALACAIVALVVLASPRERGLVLATASGFALVPRTTAQQRAADDLRWPSPVTGRTAAGARRTQA